MQYNLAPDWVKRTTRGDIPTYAEMQKYLKQTSAESATPSLWAEQTGQWEGPRLRTSPTSVQPPRELWPVSTGKDPETPYQQKVSKLLEDTRAQELTNQIRRQNLIQEMRVDRLVQDTRVLELLKKTKVQSVAETRPKKKKKKK